MSDTKTQVGQIRTEVHGHVFKIIIDNVSNHCPASAEKLCRRMEAKAKNPS